MQMRERSSIKGAEGPGVEEEVGLYSRAQSMMRRPDGTGVWLNHGERDVMYNLTAFDFFIQSGFVARNSYSQQSDLLNLQKTLIGLLAIDL